MINPNEQQLLSDFISYIEDNDYVIMKQGLMKSNSIWFNEAPRKGDKTIVNITYKSERPTEDEMDDRIEMFLKKRNRD